MSIQSTKKKTVKGPEVESKRALLLIDLITDFDFDDGDQLWKQTKKIVDPLVQLINVARATGTPIIYVNDNFGNWKEDFEAQVKRIVESSERGRELAERILPHKDDMYVLKPQRSGFYETPLAVLLESMEINDLILAGITTDICVLFTAHDAYMRGFSVSVPADCTAAVENAYRKGALELAARVAEADTSNSADLAARWSISKNKK